MKGIVMLVQSPFSFPEGTSDEKIKETSQLLETQEFSEEEVQSIQTVDYGAHSLNVWLVEEGDMEGECIIYCYSPIKR